MRAQRGLFQILLILTLLSIMLAASCAPKAKPEAVGREEGALMDAIRPEPSPTSCTGWVCEIRGKIIMDGNAADTEIPSGNVQLEQISHCSPTAGTRETAPDEIGSFSFEVYLHDTDSFVLTAIVDGYEPETLKFGGFDCLYCSCSPFEIKLQTLE